MLSRHDSSGYGTAPQPVKGRLLVQGLGNWLSHLDWAGERRATAPHCPLSHQPWGPQYPHLLSRVIDVFHIRVDSARFKDHCTLWHKVCALSWIFPYKGKAYQLVSLGYCLPASSLLRTREACLTPWNTQTSVCCVERARILCEPNVWRCLHLISLEDGQAVAC